MTRVPVDPGTVRWAREVGRVTRGDLAQRIGVTPTRIAQIEAGAAEPTFRQLTLIAEKLDRPLGFFFAAPPVLSDVPATLDFRGPLSDPDSLGGLPPRLVLELRRAQRYREAVLDFDGAPSGTAPRLAQADTAPRLAQGRDPLTPERVAVTIRSWLDLDPGDVPEEIEPQRVLAHWRAQLEQRGILVFQTTRIPPSQFRGLSVHHEVLPIIILNGGDAPAGRIFTLFHELAHLLNRTSGLCCLDEGPAATTALTAAGTANTEAWANEVAGSVLMPEPAIRAEAWPLTAAAHAVDAEAVIDAVARRFRVSPLAATVRLRRLGLADETVLARVRARTDSALTRRSASSRVPAWRLRYRDLGERYIGTVARALESERVDLVDATYLLSARLPVVEQLLTEYYRSGERT